MTHEKRRERSAAAFTKGLQMRAPEDFNEATTLCDFIVGSWKVTVSGYTGQFSSMQITLSTRQPNYQEVNLNKDKYRPRGDNANRRWRRDNRLRLGLRLTAVGALIRSLDLRARELQNTCSISDQT
ncbi:unnamed protein product [Pieris macdunnoughi]|uniref:Uncharacterized protein n=1 Tax=Pieris macdunnoughi TaxID=345717 RepID=A0A821NP35_9NEOP|nr:unnamed protein product [Pieris macdunnoughi]